MQHGPSHAVSQPRTITLDLPSGDGLRIRPMTRDDQSRLAEGFRQLSETARFQRFFTPITRLSERDLAYLTDLDQVRHFAWGVESPEGDGVAVARYVATAPGVAEAAFTIKDEYQGRGLGRRLLQALAAVANHRGFSTFEMTMLADNTAMAHLAARAGATFDPPSDGTVRCELKLNPDVWADLPELDALLALADEAARVRAHQGDRITGP